MPTIVVPGPAPESERGAYVADPVPTADRPGPWPGVVVVHDALGLGDDMREQCDWLAAAGYVTVMPDMYHGKLMIRCVKGAFQQLAQQSGPVFDQIDQARSWLAARGDCTGTVGVIGYCMGGAFALVLAGRPGYSAASVNYGPLPANLDEILDGACPMVASYGGKDRSLKGAAAKVSAALEKAAVPADVKEYPNATHAFINRPPLASPTWALMKITGLGGYDHGSAADAKRRILAFFDQYLRVGADVSTGQLDG
jgi:carboxymethylenebutenolidase